MSVIKNVLRKIRKDWYNRIKKVVKKMADKINTEHDIGYKSLLRNKKTFIEFLRDFVKKDWVKTIKEEDLILVDKEFIAKDYTEKESDIIYKVNIEGKEIILYILLELQSKVDFTMPIRLFTYMGEIWRNEISNTEEKIVKRKGYKLPAIVPIVLYNGKNKWTAVRSFKEMQSGYELFEENVVDFKYLFYDVNRMKEEELMEVSSLISAVFSLDQSDMEIDEIIKRLKRIGKFINRKSTTEQFILFKDWIIGILKNRYEEENSIEIEDIINEISEMEVEEMVSNLGKNIEDGFKKKYIEGKIEVAKNLLDILDDETIAVKTGLKLEVVQELRKKYSE
jgi:hypothetical protein